MKKLPKDSPEYAVKQKELNDNLEQIGKINKEEIQPRRGAGPVPAGAGRTGRPNPAGHGPGADRQQAAAAVVVPGAGLVIIPVVWFWVFPNHPQYFTLGVFLAGACIVAQFSYFGEYLPKVFPVHLRGTGGAFATNVGGRMIGTSAAFLTTGVIAPLVASWTGGKQVLRERGLRGRRDGLLVFGLGFLVSFFLPEPPREEKV